MTITKRVIIVEGEPVAPVNNGKVDASLEAGRRKRLLDPAHRRHPDPKIANSERRVAEMTGDTFDSELMVVADRTTPYRLLTEVLYSCGQAGYSNYRLVVLKNRE